MTTTTPPIRNGHEVLRQIDNMGLMKITVEGAEDENVRLSQDSGWKKKNIFWDLLYWETLRIRHNWMSCTLKKMSSTTSSTLSSMFLESQRIT